MRTTKHNMLQRRTESSWNSLLQGSAGLWISWEEVVYKKELRRKSAVRRVKVSCVQGKSRMC